MATQAEKIAAVKKAIASFRVGMGGAEKFVLQYDALEALRPVPEPAPAPRPNPAPAGKSVPAVVMMMESSNPEKQAAWDTLMADFERINAMPDVLPVAGD